MLLLTGGLRAVAVPGLAQAVAVFSFAVALSSQPARCVLQRHPSLRYRGLLMAKLGAAQARLGLVFLSLGACLSWWLCWRFDCVRWCPVLEGAATSSPGQGLRGYLAITPPTLPS